MQPRCIQSGATLCWNTPSLETALTKSAFHPDHEVLDIVGMVGIVRQAKKLAIQRDCDVDIVIDIAANFVRSKRFALCRAGYCQHSDDYCYSG